MRNKHAASQILTQAAHRALGALHRYIMALERSRSAIILLRSAWVGSFNWYKANPHSRLRNLVCSRVLVLTRPLGPDGNKCYFSSHGATRERAVAPAVCGLALMLGYVHVAIGVLLRTKHKLVRYLTCGECEEAHNLFEFFVSS